MRHIIAERAREATVTLRDGIIQYRHPWITVVDDEGNERGVIVRKGVGKLSEDAQDEIKRQCRIMLERAPQLEEDAPTVSTDVHNWYFVPFKLVNDDRSRLKVLKVKGKTFIFAKKKSGSNEVAMLRQGHNEHIDLLVSKISELNDEKEALRKEAERLRHGAIRVQREVGERSVEEKSMTLQTCFDHWHKSFKAKSASQTRATIKRVKKVLEKLGFSRLHGVVTLADIVKAIEDTKPSEYERVKSSQSIKRFFWDLCKPKNENGKDFISNPAQNLKPGSLKKIQQQKVRKNRGVGLLDPKDILDLVGPSKFIKTLAAVLGYAGLRLSEAARLQWSMIDFDKQIIDVPGKKTAESVRAVKPFPNLWDLLKDWKATGNTEDLLFPFIDVYGVQNSKKDWFHEMYDGAETKCSLTKFMNEQLDLFIPNVKNRAYGLRHWYSTKMHEMGYRHLESSMAGHSEKTAREYYVDHRRLAENAEIKAV